MARVELSADAVAALVELISTHSLPEDTPLRVVDSLRPLQRFPFVGRALEGEWSGFRFLLGPWNWMVLVYTVLEDGERVMVVAVEDARSSSPPTAT